MTSPSSPPPVAFRLKRPYADGDEFVAGDGHGISRGGMVLIGAGPRPPGLIVRFEIALRDGTALFRGEGKVVTHRPTADGAHPAGLEIRFTRLDASGKSLVDRVLRERASAATPPPAPAIPDLTPGAPRSVEATRPLPAVVGVVGVPAARPSPVEIELTPAPAPNLPPVVAAPPPAPASVDIVIDADDGPPTEPPNPEATVMAPPVALADLSPEPTTAAPAAVPYGPGDPPEPESTEEPTTLVRMAVVSVAPPPSAPPSSGPAAAPASAPAPLEPVAASASAVARAAAPAAPPPADRASLLGRLRGRGGGVARPPERDTLLGRLRERVRTPA